MKVDTGCIEVIPHCISAQMTDTQFSKLKAGNDSVCVPREYEGKVHSIGSLRSLFISYLYLFDWCRWDPWFISHGAHVAGVLGIIPTSVDGLPKCIEVGKLCSEILKCRPSLGGNRVLSLIHPSLFNRGLPKVMLNLIKRLPLTSRLLRETSSNRLTCRVVRT